MNTLRCISWIAVSSQPQTEKESPEEQREANAAVVDRLNGRLVAELSIPGLSRDIISFERACERIDAYGRLNDLIRAKAADVLVCRDLSRLGRTQALVAQVVAYCQDAGIAIYPRNAPPTSLVAREQQDSDANTLLLAINASFAEIELTTFKRRYQYGMRGRVKRGLHFNRIGYGWKKTFDREPSGRGNESVVLDEAAAAAIRKALVDLYLREGYSQQETADEMNALGYAPPSGRKWTRNVVNSLMRRLDVFSGWTTANLQTGAVRARAAFPAILTHEEAAAIQAEKEQRVAGKSGRRNYVFSGMLACTCGATLVGQHRTYRDVIYRYYRCKTCGYHLREEDVVEELRRVVAFAADRDNHADLLAQTPDTGKRIEADLIAVVETLASIDSQRLRLTRAYTTEAIDDEEYRRLMAELATRKDAIEGKQTQLQDALGRAENQAGRGDRLEELATEGWRWVEAAKDAGSGEGAVRKLNARLRRLLHFTVDNRRIVRVEFL